MKITLISTTSSPEDQGIRTISSILKREGYNVVLVFMTLGDEYYKLYKKRQLEQLKELCKDSSLVGVNCFINTKPKAVQIINFLKKEFPYTPLVFGGIHVTIAPKDCINDANILCIGEGEGAMLDLANAIRDNKPPNKIKNLWTKENGRWIKNEVRNLVDDLDNLPYPDFDIDTHFILDKNIRKFQEKDLRGEILFLSGRGCPYGCAYCSNSTYNELYCGKRKKIVRHHSIDYIINFFKIMKKRFKSLIYMDLRDDTFTIRSFEDIKDFSKKYKKQINLPFKITVDANTITEDKIKYLVKAGCSDVSLGIQGSERVNKEIYHRNISEENILRSAKILNKYKDKIAVNYDIMVTNPYEEKQDLLNLIDLIKKLPKPFRLFPNNLTFFIGSKLYNRAVGDGTIKSFEDTGIPLKYENRAGHILLKRKNVYLNLILNLMRGLVTENKYGGVYKVVLDELLETDNILSYDDDSKFILFFVYVLMYYDFMKYRILRPIYSRFPNNLKSWITRKRIGGKIKYSEIHTR